MKYSLCILAAAAMIAGFSGCEKPAKESPEAVAKPVVEKAEDWKGVESVFISLINKFPDNLAYQVSLARLYNENKEINKVEKNTPRNGVEEP